VNTSESKIAQYLQDAQVLEGTLRRTLISHIAVSARDEHRRLLEDHLRVTIAQERRLASRLADLGGGPNIAQSAVGAAKGAAALVLTLAKGPADALRGPTGDDVALRNAQDECASEALEIAVYDALEALATELGDERTAELARRHREQEQDFLDRLRDTVPGLARNVAQNRKGSRRFPLGTVGALDAARALVTGAQTVLRPGGSDGGSIDDHTRTQAASASAPATTPKPKKSAAGRLDVAAPPIPRPRAAARARPAAPAKRAGAPTPPPAPATAPADRRRKPVAPTAAPKPAAAAAPKAKPKPKPKPAAAAPRPKPTPAAAAAPKPQPTPAADQPLAQYDDMTPYEITELLDHLADDKLDAVEQYERAHENRDQVLDAITKQRAAPDVRG
jgi:ferritin-like metal-binding protein YciE